MGEAGGLVDEELGARPWSEDSGVHGYPQAGELCPAEDVLKGLADDSPFHQGGQLGRRLRRLDEQVRLVFGEDAASVPKPGDDGGSLAR
jgi:hypothetical protein